MIIMADEANRLAIKNINNKQKIAQEGKRWNKSVPIAIKKERSGRDADASTSGFLFFLYIFIKKTVLSPEDSSFVFEQIGTEPLCPFH